MIYADTSILVSLVMHDANSMRAVDLVRTAGKALAFNQLLRLEVGNAIRLCEASGKMGAGDVAASQQVVEELLQTRQWFSIEPSWERVFEWQGD